MLDEEQFTFCRNGRHCGRPCKRRECDNRWQHAIPLSRLVRERRILLLPSSGNMLMCSVCLSAQHRA